MISGPRTRAEQQEGWTFWPEVSILCVALGLYAFQLGQESLWIDEMLSIDSARGALDLNRPLYFVLLRGWLHVGEEEVWLRSLSVLFGVACLTLTYCLGRRLVSRSVGLVAGLLFALSPLAINHTQEVRFYMMSACLGVAGSLCLSYALEKPGVAALSGWIAFRCLGFLTAQPNLLLVVPDLVLVGGMAAAWRGRYGKAQLSLRRWGWSLGVLLVPIVLISRDVVGPLIEFLLEQRWYAGEACPPTVSNLVGLLAALTAWPLAGPDAASVFYQPIFKLYAVLSLVGALLPVTYRKLRSPQLIWLSLWGFVPIVLVFLLSQVFPFLWLERYAVISIPFVAILLATSWVWVWNRRKRVAIALALFYFVAISGPLLRYYTTDYRADWRGLSQEISLLAETGDPVVIYPGSFLPYIDYYYDGDAELVPLEKIEDAADVEREGIANNIQALSLPSNRFWLVCPIKDQWKNAQADVLEELSKKGFVLEKTSARVNHWNWGPVLYLFEDKQS